MAPKVACNPEKYIPALTGKVFFITGGTSGLGKQTILQLAKHESVIADVRKIAASIEVKFYDCDQASLASVNAVASSFLSSNPDRLDVLICNAGRMGGPLGLTKDGYEIQFGINFLAHALFTKRFLPLLERTATEHGDARIVNLTSAGYAMHSAGIPFKDLKTTQQNIGIGGKWARYGQSKFAQVIYMSELAKRFPNITTVAIHPGVVHTGLIEDQPIFDRLFVKLTTLGQSIPLEQGCYNTCWAATADKSGLKSGGVYYPVGVPMEHTKAASDEALWKELWDWTDEELESLSQA